MISSALLAFSLAVCSFGGALASAEVHRSANIPDWNSSYEYPTEIQLVPSYVQSRFTQQGAFGYQYADSWSDFDFTWAGQWEYFPVSATYTVDNGSLTLQSVRWWRGYAPNQTDRGVPCVPDDCWSFIASEIDTTFKLYNPYVKVYFTSGNAVSMDDDYDQFYGYGGRIANVSLYNYSGVSAIKYFSLDADDNVWQAIEEYVALKVSNYVDVDGAAYERGYGVGYYEGEQYGEAVGYNNGISQSQAGGSGLFYRLFGALVNVPISIVNGLSPLAFWDTPIISIILSFLAIGVVLVVVKKFVL